jgi:biotin carboxylase
VRSQAARTVAVVQPYASGSMLAPALRHAGFAPCAVTLAAAAPNAASFRPADFDQHIVCESGDLETAEARLRALNPVAIIPGTHTGVRLADWLAARLTPQLANAPGLASARWHKGDMHAAVAANGLPVIKSLCTRDPAEVQRWLAAAGLAGRDLVIKPAASSGTDGVTFVPRGRDWRAVVTKLADSVNRYGIHLAEVMVQEYVPGTEYAVDTFSYDGRHTVADIARYHKVSSDKHMALYESMEFVPYDDPGHAEIIGYVERVLDALGVRFGPAHTEIMVTDRGPLLIETNARIPGGGQPWVCQLATGDNLIDRIIRYLGGDRSFHHGYTLDMTVLVVFFAVQSAGDVGDISGLDAIEDLPSCCHFKINVREGDHVPETADLFDAHNLGVVVLGHSEPSQVHADHAEVRRIASGIGRPGGFSMGAGTRDAPC